MSTLPTLGLLSVVDGRLMGDMGDVYRVISHFIGREAFTHELPMFAEKARPMIAAHWPLMDAGRALEWQDVRDDVLRVYGETVEAPPEWEGALLETRTPLETLAPALQRARRQ